LNRAGSLALVPVLMLLASCGVDDEVLSAASRRVVSLHAGKGVSVELTLPASDIGDSLTYRDGNPVELILSSDGRVSLLSAMLVPGCGSSPADRMAYLDDGEVKNLDTSSVEPYGDTDAFTAVIYVKGDSSVVERVWSRGSGELAVLQVKSGNTSLNILLSSVSGILSTAGVHSDARGLTRSVHLSDRTRSEIVREVNADVAEPPDISHRIGLSVDPSAREMSVVDTLTIDFRTTQSDSQLTMYVPRCEDGTSFQALRGRITNCSDSVICIPDSARIFTGIYSGSWKGFISSTTDRITTDGMRIDRAISFQCGMWFYPGCGIPAEYVLRISVPERMGYSVYAPLDESDRTVGDSLLTVTFTSHLGGVKGPLAWAAGGFTTHGLAGGRSLFVCQDPDSTDTGLMELADELASVLWRNLGYDGARLDMIIVNVLDFPVLVTGPGCVFLSRDMLESVRGYGAWADSLAAGRSVPATAIMFETARAFLAGSTYLSDNLRDVLAGWAVCRLMLSEDPDAAPELMDALMKYYLYSTGETGGTEYAIADPMLAGSPLYQPVVLGKAPVVMEFLHDQIPAFERAIPRALGNLRHSGDSFGRLFSAMGVMESGRYGEMYFRWFYGPGVPLLRVQWSDSAEMLDIRVMQLQPGQDFPLGSIMDRVTVHTAAGSYELPALQGSSYGHYTADVSGITERITALDIDPSGVLPADIVYSRSAAYPEAD